MDIMNWSQGPVVLIEGDPVLKVLLTSWTFIGQVMEWVLIPTDHSCALVV
jgi:hypothetical protein